MGGAIMSRVGGAVLVLTLWIVSVPCQRDSSGENPERQTGRQTGVSLLRELMEHLYAADAGEYESGLLAALCHRLSTATYLFPCVGWKQTMVRL